MKFFISYPYIVYSFITWVYIFIFIKLEGIKRLWPISIVSAIILFISTYWLILLNLYRFNISFLSILGIPFFYILWGAGSGIIFANYIGDKFYQKVISILGFSSVVVIAESIIENYKRVEHLGKFNNGFQFVFDIFILSMLAFLITNLFPNRLLIK